MHAGDSQKNHAAVAADEPRGQASIVPQRLPKIGYQRFTADPQPDLYPSGAPNPTYGLTPEAIAKKCKVNLSTARRWKDGTSRVPFAAASLLLGELGAFGEPWQRWRISGTEIISPDGLRVSRNDALAVPYLLAQISALKEQVAGLKEWMEKSEQPVPGEIPQIKA